MIGLQLVEIRRLNKTFGGVKALHDVSLAIAPGEVHALCGENGAGKSTLIKILTGTILPDTGEVCVGGRPLPLGQVQQSEAAGIAAMHQESTALPDLNAVDNIFVGRELTTLRGMLLARREMRRRTCELLERLGERFRIDVPLRELSLAQRQMVALARALSRNCRLLIMDEPTASLSARETRTLLDLVRQLRDEGVSVLYVTHRLEEVFHLADRVTVLRDGELVKTADVAEISSQKLIQWMVGRELDELGARHEHAGRPGDPVLEVRGLSQRTGFQDVSLSLRRGEILGLAGLVGAGRSELARALFGIDRYDRGEVLVDGKPLRGGSVLDAIAAGLALVPEDRQHEGLILPMSVAANLSLPMLDRLTRWGLIRRSAEEDLVKRQIEDLQVKTAGAAVAAATLSGGNQQKLVIGKWLAGNPRVLVLDEPTRGVDVGAKAQVHRLIRQLAASGVAILLISSELPEILSLSDRILVMREGRLVGELAGAGADQQRVLELALPQSSRPT